MNAIKNLQWLAVAVCLFVMGTIQVMADDKKDDAPSVPIPLTTGSIYTGDDLRGIIAVPFTAYYQNGTIYISSMGEFTTIAVSVVNEITRQEWDTTMDVSDGMGEICITSGGAGNYSVEIVTEYGECFVGDFEL